MELLSLGQHADVAVRHPSRAYLGKALGRVAIFVAVVAISGTQPGCALLNKAFSKHRKRSINRGPQLVGIVRLVNPDGGFVLIDSGTNPPPNAEINLKCKTGSVESAELKVSEVRRPPFVIADIVKGTPLKGDVVYQLPVAK